MSVLSTLAILCSGQGAQARGMFDLVGDAAEAADVFAAASAALDGRDPRAIVEKGDADDLHANATAQILCCTQALAAWTMLRPAMKGRRLVIAGYSIGEVAAWSVAGAFDAERLFEIVAKRAALMDAATKQPSGLLAIRGLSTAAIEKLSVDAGVHVAIRNAADRIVVGGTREALDRAAELAPARGAEGVTAIPVGVPSHTPLLREASQAFGEYLGALETVGKPAARIVSGIDGAPVFDLRDGLAKLARQVAETVDWAACLEACRAAGATKALELGPGDALARMMGDVIGAENSRSLSDFRSAQGALRWCGS